jgi:hypothetical protein
MYEACINVPAVPYYRYPHTITTTLLGEFIEAKAKVVLEKLIEENKAPVGKQIDVKCFPVVLGDKRQGIKYAAMVIGMNGVGEDGDTLYDKVRMHSYRPRIMSGIQNVIVRGYEFSDEKLRLFRESPKHLRGLALSPKDIEFLHSRRKLQISNFHGKPYHYFYADMDRILDDALMDSTVEDPEIPNYITVGIKSLGDKPDSPLSYDILLTTDPRATNTDMSALFKTLVSR